MTLSFWLNILLLLFTLLVAFIYLRRDYIREKVSQKRLEEFVWLSKTEEAKKLNSYAKQYRKIPDPNKVCPRLDRDGFTFVDLAESATKLLPQYALPTLSEKRGVQPGDHVLLCIQWAEDIAGHDAWVLVESIQSDDYFVGRIISVDVETEVHILEKEVVFNTNHIADIDRPNTHQKPN